MKKIIVMQLLITTINCNAQKIQNEDLVKIINTASLTNNKNTKNKIVKGLIAPTVLIGYGLIELNNKSLQNVDLTTKVEIIEDHPTFKTKIDNYLQYSPAIAVYGLNALGIKGKNNFKDRTFIYGLSTVISSAFVLSIKKITNVQRPDASGFNSFPSGHTTTAFAAAEFLRQEYKDVSPWYGIAGYTAATATGILRMYNNKHWVSDVVAGAGFGILSTKLAYWVYPIIQKRGFKTKGTNTFIAPFYQSGGGGISMLYHFK